MGFAFWGKRIEFPIFVHPKIFYFEILGSPNLNLCLRPTQLNEFGAGAGYILQGGRKVMDFFILHKVLRMFRLTPPPRKGQKSQLF